MPSTNNFPRWAVWQMIMKIWSIGEPPQFRLPLSSWHFVHGKRIDDDEDDYSLWVCYEETFMQHGAWNFGGEKKFVISWRIAIWRQSKGNYTYPDYPDKWLYAASQPPKRPSARRLLLMQRLGRVKMYVLAQWSIEFFLLRIIDLSFSFF